MARESAALTDGEEFTNDGIYVAGIVNAGRNAWGTVILMGPNGQLKGVGCGVPDGLWVLERAPDGTMGAGGKGAYRLQADDQGSGGGMLR